MAHYEDDLACDLAETYGIFDMYEFSSDKIAILTHGLPLNSRVMRKLSGQSVDVNTILLASIVDQLNLLLWIQQTGRQHTGRPDSVVDKLLKQERDKSRKNNTKGYETPESFNEARKRIINMVCGGEMNGQ